MLVFEREREKLILKELSLLLVYIFLTLNSNRIVCKSSSKLDHYFIVEKEQLFSSYLNISEIVINNSFRLS